MYPWKITDVLNLLGINYVPGKEEIITDCPFPDCRSPRFALNTIKGVGVCRNCNRGLDSVGFYAISKGVSKNDARAAIEEQLNVSMKPMTRAPKMVYRTPADIPMATSKIRNATYEAFLNELQLSQKHKTFLIAKGFSEIAIESRRYRTLPRRDEVNYEGICKRLLEKNLILKGVPGFYLDDSGNWTFVQLTPGILVPQLNVNNEIEALQLLKDEELLRFDESIGGIESPYCWFSSRGAAGGTGVQIHSHWATDCIYDGECDKYWPTPAKGYIVTSGLLNADLINDLFPQFHVIAIADPKDIPVLRKTLKVLKLLDTKRVIDCFGVRETTENKTLCDELKGYCKEEGLEYERQDWNIRIQIENNLVPCLLGFDDFLAYKVRKIIPKVTTMKSKKISA